jgi:hypothetical protein
VRPSTKGQFRVYAVVREKHGNAAFASLLINVILDADGGATSGENCPISDGSGGCSFSKPPSAAGDSEKPAATACATTGATVGGVIGGVTAVGVSVGAIVAIKIKKRQAGRTIQV